jgi:hypothetical protein
MVGGIKTPGWSSGTLGKRPRLSSVPMGLIYPLTKPPVYILSGAQHSLRLWLPVATPGTSSASLDGLHRIGAMLSLLATGHHYI